MVTDYRGYRQTLLPVREINLKACTPVILKQFILPGLGIEHSAMHINILILHRCNNPNECKAWSNLLNRTFLGSREICKQLQSHRYSCLSTYQKQMLHKIRNKANKNIIYKNYYSHFQKQKKNFWTLGIVWCTKFIFN